MKPYVKIDRKVLFEICDAILNSDGSFTDNTCPESEDAYSCWRWDKEFYKKVENIRNNS